MNKVSLVFQKKSYNYVIMTFKWSCSVCFYFKTHFPLSYVCLFHKIYIYIYLYIYQLQSGTFKKIYIYIYKVIKV